MTESKAATSARGIDTRRAIDRAAVELFSKLGYHAASMRAIASAANVQPAAIYHWYPNKESILIHLQDEFMRELTFIVESAVSEQVGPVARFAAAIREHVLFHGRHQQEAFATDSEIRALSRQPRTALIAKRDAYQRFFRDLIVEGERLGVFHPADPDVATYAILLQCTGVALWFKAEGALSIDDVADYHVDLALGSLHTSRRDISSALKSARAATTA
jgi:AcrR family transcriptional regulator